jgi:hypothetical protein
MIIQLSPKDYEGDMEVYINSKDISKLYADKKRFFIDTKKQLKTLNIKIIQDKLLGRGCLLIKWKNKCKNASIDSYLLQKYKEGYWKSL